MKRGLLLIILLALSGCQRDRYQLISAGRETVYRLDKSTGEVILIAGSDSYKVRTPEETEQAEREEQEAKATLEKAAAEKEKREQRLPPTGGFEEFFTGTDFDLSTAYQ